MDSEFLIRMTFYVCSALAVIFLAEALYLGVIAPMRSRRAINKRLSVHDCLEAVDQCGAPVVSIPGGEPLIHKEIVEIVEGIVARKKFVYLCTNALLLEKNVHKFKPSVYLTFSVHLDGLGEAHDKAVAQKGTFDRAVSAIRAAKKAGFRVNVNCTVFNNMSSDEAIEFFDFCTKFTGSEFKLK